jgi:hypothetical protein
MSTFTKRIDSDIRDVDHYNNGTTWYLNEGMAYYLGNTSGSNTNGIGLRFTAVNIPNGAVINSAKITFIPTGTKTLTLAAKITGVDEDNTAEFVASPENSARTRTHTTADVTWSGSITQTNNVALDTPDIKSVVQEIVSRGSWSSGNAMAFYLYNNGSGSGNYLYLYEYSDNTAKAALLTIDYSTVSASPSLSPSASPSLSPSVSPSQSPSAGTSISPSPSPSISPSKSPSLSPSRSPSVSPSVSTSPSKSSSISPSVSPSPPAGDYGLKVMKAGHDITDQDIKDMVFTSAKGVLGLKQLTTYTKTTDANGNISSTDSHSIGYVPVVIVSFTAYDGNTVLLPIEWHSVYLNGSRETIEVTETVSFTIDATNIYFTVHAEDYNHDTFVGSNISGRNYIFKVYYYFNEITENY